MFLESSSYNKTSSKRITFVFATSLTFTDLPARRALRRTERGDFEREPRVRRVDLRLAPGLLQEDEGRQIASSVLHLRFLPRQARRLEKTPPTEKRLGRHFRQGHGARRHFRRTPGRQKGRRVPERGGIRRILHVLRHRQIHVRLDRRQLAGTERLAGRVRHDVRPQRRARLLGRQGQALERHEFQGQTERGILRDGFREGRAFRGFDNFHNLVQRMARGNADRRGRADVLRGLQVLGLPSVRTVVLPEDDEKMGRSFRRVSARADDDDVRAKVTRIVRSRASVECCRVFFLEFLFRECVCICCMLRLQDCF